MIPQDTYESYRRALTENNRQARRAVEQIIDSVHPLGAEAMRDVLLEAYPKLVKLYGNRAVRVAFEFYTSVRNLQGIKTPFEPATDNASEDIEQECERDIRREVGGLLKGSSTNASFSSVMQGLAAKRTMQMADMTLIHLANADPAKPKWAFVPHPGACGWCVMIGSRGFDYASNKTAENMRHDNCLCMVVADFDGKNPGLEGYDPEAMADAYLRCREAVEEDARRAWKEMGEEERGKYKRGYDGYLRNRIVGEMNTRDREWLRSGVVPQPTYQSKRALFDLRPHEKITRDTIARSGLPQHVIERSNEPNVKTADCLLGVNSKRADWKSPIGTGFNAIDQLMRDAGKKADIAVVDLQEGRSAMSLKDAIGYWRACGERRGIREAYFIDYDRTMRHLKL